jgi:hypothetical protein
VFVVLLLHDGAGRVYRAPVFAGTALVVSDRTEADRPDTFLAPVKRPLSSQVVLASPGPRGIADSVGGGQAIMSA